jgi:signal peptidase I
MQRAARFALKGMVGLLVVCMLLAATAIGYARQNHLELLSVQSGSMAPAIRRGDAVLLHRQINAIRPGDIISFRHAEKPGVMITHRVLSAEGAEGPYVTMGDATDRPDAPVQHSQVAGVVRRVVPLGGYGLDYLRRPAGLVAAVYIPAGIVCAGEIKRLMRYYERRHYRLYA